jgi:hypothetical protein
MKNMFINVITLLAIFTFFGCSSKDSTSYYILHNLAKQECNKIINPDERQQCLQEHNEPFNPNKFQNTNQ